MEVSCAWGRTKSPESEERRQGDENKKRLVAKVGYPKCERTESGNDVSKMSI